MLLGAAAAAAAPCTAAEAAAALAKLLPAPLTVRRCRAAAIAAAAAERGLLLLLALKLDDSFLLPLLLPGPKWLAVTRAAVLPLLPTLTAPWLNAALEPALTPRGLPALGLPPAPPSSSLPVLSGAAAAADAAARGVPHVPGVPARGVPPLLELRCPPVTAIITPWLPASRPPPVEALLTASAATRLATALTAMGPRLGSSGTAEAEGASLPSAA